MLDLPLWYLWAALLVAGGVTFALRALPFAILEPLKKSTFVQVMASWMPAGILVILALSTFGGSIEPVPGSLFVGIAAAAVTIIVHYISGRKTLLSVGAGTLVFVLLTNFALPA